MKGFMGWKECEKRFVRKVSVDTNKISSLIKTADARMEHLKASEITVNSVSFIVEGYYEVINGLLVALLLSKGLKSSNHQCLITYFYDNYKEYESHAYLISQMSYLRNRLDYYGELIDKSFFDKNKEKIFETIKLLKELVT